MKTQPVLELADAQQILAAAQHDAQQRGLRVAIAVCDAGGHLLSLLRMDGAPPMSATLAPEKARASAMALRPSQALEEMVNKGRFAALKLPLTPLEGGEMIVCDGQCIGAVGVSGARASDDALIARAGVAAIGAAGAISD